MNENENENKRKKAELIKLIESLSKKADLPLPMKMAIKQAMRMIDENKMDNFLEILLDFLGKAYLEIERINDNYIDSDLLEAKPISEVKLIQ